jgi:spermidine synthase
MLTLVLGTSVYSFAIMLAAFLSGIALGSQAFGLAARRIRASRAEIGGALVFAATQIAIGVAALGVTVLMRDLPGLAGPQQLTHRIEPPRNAHALRALRRARAS